MATMIIEGERATAASGETYQVKNPATGEVVDEVPSGGVEDVARAARAAEKAQRSWGRLAPSERARAHVSAPDEMTAPAEIAAAVARFVLDDSMAGRVLVCWCGMPWALVAPGDFGYARFEVTPAPPAAAPSDGRGGAG